MNRGEVYRFNYLWGHEAERGRTGSRKIRKVCLVMQVGEWLYLFPFTSLEPKPVEGRDRLYLEVPEIEKKRAGLSAEKPSYLILDDYNRVRIDRLYDFESLTAVGALSPRSLRLIARRFLDAVAEQRRLHGVTRG